MNKKNTKIFQLIKNSISLNKTLQTVLFCANKNIELDSYILYLVNEIQNTNFKSLSELKKHLNFNILGEEHSIYKDDVINSINESFSNMNRNEKNFVIIKNIENGSVQSLNALLKYIESLTEDIILIMTTNNKQKILPTILSRSFVIDIQSKQPQNLEKETKFKKSNFGEFWKYLTDDVKVFKKMYSPKNEIILNSIFSQINENNYEALLATLTKEFNSDNADLIIQFLNCLFTEIALLKNGVKPRIFEINSNIEINMPNTEKTLKLLAKNNKIFDNGSYNFAIQKASFISELGSIYGF